MIIRFSSMNRHLRKSVMDLECLKRALFRLKGEPVTIARGFSIGVFVGMTPFFGIHSLISVSLSLIFRANPLASLLGIQVTNVFTAPLLYALSYKVGSMLYPSDRALLLPDDFTLQALFHWLTTLSDVVIILSIGGVILGIPFAFISHFCVYYIAKRTC